MDLPKVGDAIAVEIVVLKRIAPEVFHVGESLEKPPPYTESVITAKERLWGDVLSVNERTNIARVKFPAELRDVHLSEIKDCRPTLKTIESRNSN